MENVGIYFGEQYVAKTKKLSVPTLDVLELVGPIETTNRNVTGDKWFTSIELFDDLKAKGLTYVGTMRKNKRDVGLLFGFTGDRTLVSFVQKKIEV